ncbi:hypothetical protein IFR04_011278 [Cadophora malorum]|uniref:DUF7730 domain-containing protein n=1 Tax=Cadophora malorum TaxID=108018 RepID=A0A8H7T5M4_9HELO|nr:hypothetical protein IFR04_011278 [Cadophora malorum]
MSPPTSEKPTPEQTSARDENHSPFLNAPIEVRVNIYSYLVPNFEDPLWYERHRRCHREAAIDMAWNEVRSTDNPHAFDSYYSFARRNHGYSLNECHVRTDGVEPAFALLTTCRQVYEEYVKEFYGHARFSIRILASEIWYFDEVIKDPGFGFKFIKHLKVTLPMPGLGDENKDEMAAGSSHSRAVTRLLNLLKNSPLIRSIHLQLELPKQLAMATCLIATRHRRNSPLFRALMSTYRQEIASRVCPILELKDIEKTVSIRESFLDTQISREVNPRLFGAEVRGFVAGLLERYGLPTLSAKEELESKVMTKKISASVVGAAHVASMINYTRVPLFALMEELWQRGHEAAAEMELETKIADGESIA